MKIIRSRSLSRSAMQALYDRPGNDDADIHAEVASILRNVEEHGDVAIQESTMEFDRADVSHSAVSVEEFTRAREEGIPAVKEAILRARESLTIFHRLQKPAPVEITTMPGVQCRLEWRPIERVGLYVPGGTAPLISTVLMLGIPAIIAECPEIILCTPPRPDGTVCPDILVAASTLGLTSVFKIGGALAIAAMAVGTESVPKVAKIFGPGNRYVAAMKSLVSKQPRSVTIDMIAGPSELLVIADGSANPQWIAADLLSQAEHGIDSPVILVTTSVSIAEEVLKQVALQLSSLPRMAIASQAIEQSYILLVETIEEAVEFSNSYAPEHLMLATEDPASIVGRVVNAGSVFLGSMTSVVFGDYASGTNHTLPTSRTAVSSGGLTVRDFLKPIFIQNVTQQGLASLSTTVKQLARAEGLEAHSRAIEVRESTL